MRIALVSRELHPYVGGGIAPIVAAAARQLAAVADVQVFTSGGHREQHDRLAAAGDPWLLPPEIGLHFVDEPEPDEVGGFYSHMHAYSERVDLALRAAYPDRGPDLIEFCDYLAEGFVTVEARQTSDPWLRDTIVATRLHTTAQLCNVLDGLLSDEFASEAVYEAERFVLRHSDRLLWSGGDVLGTYARFYGDLAPGVRLPDAFLSQDDRPLAAPRAGDGPLELLYVGRFERRKGVQNLVRAVADLGHPDLHLKLLGGDTKTAPLASSLRTQVELMVAADPRIELLAPVDRAEVGRLIDEAHAVVVPSLWECWPNVGREALQRNRPLLATPVGGLRAMARPGVSGWLARGTDRRDLAEALRPLAEDPGQAATLAAAGGPRRVFDELCDPAALTAGYERLVAEHRPATHRRARPAGGRRERVSIVVPYFKLERHVEETVASALAQTHRDVEVIVVNDGSLREQDRPLYSLDDPRVRVVTQPNAGLGAARNLGISQACGHYVLPLDADDVIEPTFVERCLTALRADAALAYVTTWVAYMAPDGTPLTGWGAGYMPIGNWSTLIHRNNVGGTCTAVFRRRVFDRGFRYSHDMTSYEDWLLYLELAEAGLFGGVIPERLFRYRVRDDSMMRATGRPNTALLVRELRAHLKERSMAWVPQTA